MAKKHVWFGFKGIFKLTQKGKPKRGKAKYIEDTTFLEERIIILKARDFDHAIELGEKEAFDYEDNYVNVFGQNSSITYTGICDAYMMFDDPDNKKEIFSSIKIFDDKLSRKEIGDSTLGPKYSKSKESQLRLKLRAEEFNGDIVNKLDKMDKKK